MLMDCMFCFFFFQAEDGIRDDLVTGVQTCALPICRQRGRDSRATPPGGVCAASTADGRSMGMMSCSTLGLIRLANAYHHRGIVRLGIAVAHPTECRDRMQASGERPR